MSLDKPLLVIETQPVMEEEKTGKGVGSEWHLLNGSSGDVTHKRLIPVIR
jgi:hypothetical protein